MEIKTMKGFLNLIHKVMEHNGYTQEMTTTTECLKKDKWTPVDLIIREYLNNGAGSSKGFLGVTPARCVAGYDFAVDHKEELIEMNMISKDGWNNFGFPLWKDYGFER